MYFQRKREQKKHAKQIEETEARLLEQIRNLQLRKCII